MPESVSTSLLINLFRDEITSVYFNEKANNNVQSHNQTNIIGEGHREGAKNSLPCFPLKLQT